MYEQQVMETQYQQYSTDIKMDTAIEGNFLIS